MWTVRTDGFVQHYCDKNVNKPASSFAQVGFADRKTEDEKFQESKYVKYKLE